MPTERHEQVVTRHEEKKDEIAGTKPQTDDKLYDFLDKISKIIEELDTM